MRLAELVTPKKRDQSLPPEVVASLHQGQTIHHLIANSLTRAAATGHPIIGLTSVKNVALKIMSCLSAWEKGRKRVDNQQKM